MFKALPPSRWPGAAAGLAACVAVAGAAIVLHAAEVRWLGRDGLESVALAILIGAVVRLAWKPGPSVSAGVRLGAKTVLEVAIVLLGASMSIRALLGIGPLLLVVIAALVMTAILASYGLGRAFRLPHRLAVLVACGNSICGNSAIAAVAPAIEANSEEVAASIGLTAALGVATVLVLPLLWRALGLNALEYGALAGLTVYAVPQVLAAAAPAGAAAVQMGALIKLARVLMLGPVTFAAAILARRGTGAKARLAAAKAAPWFIIGFLLMMAARSAGAIPSPWSQAAEAGSSGMTVVAMAALGLETDLAAVARSGLRVGAVAILSLVGLGAMALMIVRWRFS